MLRQQSDEATRQNEDKLRFYPTDNTFGRAELKRAGHTRYADGLIFETAGLLALAIIIWHAAAPIFEAECVAEFESRYLPTRRIHTVWQDYHVGSACVPPP